MTIPPENHGVVITQREVYDRVQAIDDKLDSLVVAVEQMVAINRRLDQHHDRLNNHSDRLRTAEAKILAQGVIFGIVVTVLGGVAIKFLTG